MHVLSAGAVWRCLRAAAVTLGIVVSALAIVVAGAIVRGQPAGHGLQSPSQSPRQSLPQTSSLQIAAMATEPLPPPPVEHPLPPGEQAAVESPPVPPPPLADRSTVDRKPGTEVSPARVAGAHIPRRRAIWRSARLQSYPRSDRGRRW